MIRLSQFDFHAPDSFAKALEILAGSNGDTKILAGGTDLIVGMKQGVSRPERVVWLGKVRELQELELTNEGGLRIGAMCRLDDIERNESVKRRCSSLIKVIRSIASPQIRNRATIGGNLCLNTRCFYYDQSEFWRGSLGYCLKHGSGVCHAAPGLKSCSAVFPSDLAPFLIALNSSVKVCGLGGERNILLRHFYSDDGSNHLALRPGEILSEVVIPSHSLDLRSGFEKLRLRGSIDYPLVNVATSASVDSGNVVRSIRIVLGAVQTMPVELQSLENILLGKRLTPELIHHTAQEAVALVKPVPNSIESVHSRKVMVGRLVKKSLASLLGSPESDCPSSKCFRQMEL